MSLFLELRGITKVFNFFLLSSLRAREIDNYYKRSKLKWKTQKGEQYRKHAPHALKKIIKKLHTKNVAKRLRATIFAIAGGAKTLWGAIDESPKLLW